MRIFVTLGTHPQQFNRLLKEVDSISKKPGYKFFAQTGNSTYTPKNCPSNKFIKPGPYEQEFARSDIIISHGGAGAIIAALRQKKPLIIVPRLRKHGEHTDDHQLDLAEAMGRRGKAIAVFDLKELPKAIENAKKFRAEKESEREMLAGRIKKFLKDCE